MALSINILSDEFVKPSSPTKDDLKKYNISLLDELNPNIPIPLILYYHHHQHQQTTDFHFSRRLKESLSDTLTLFYPLAGRLKTGESSVDCNDMGVRYLEVKVDSNISDVIEDNHEAKLHDQFIPTLMMAAGTTSIKEDENDLSSSLLLLAIQINYFNCGGIAIGARFAHKIVDACTLISFMTTWATLVRKGNVKPPRLISSTIFPPSNEKLLVEIPPNKEEEEGQVVVVRRFVFDSRMISCLRAKMRIDRPNMVEPSRVGVVSAFIWKCSITTHGGGEKIYMLAQGVDIRPRMVPPVTEDVFGNLATPAFAISSEESDLGTMVEKIREGIEKIDHKYVRWFGLEGGYKAILGMGEKKKQGEGEEQVGSNISKKAEIFKLSSWCRLPVYEVDFGMGKPVWVGLVSNSLKNSAILMDSKSGKGIEAWVTMTEEDFTKFQLAFTEANNAC